MKDFLSFAYQTEPDFSLLALKAPFEEIARRFSDIHRAKKRIHNVPLRQTQEFELVDSRFVSIVEVRGGPWVIIFRSVLCSVEEEIDVSVRDAKSLSAYLKTKAIAFIGESTSDAMRYQIFAKGKMLEAAEWTSGCGLISFESKVRRKPVLEGTGDDFADNVFRSEGIYLPACYCRCENGTSWLAAESASVTSITRVDFILKPAG